MNIIPNFVVFEGGDGSGTTTQVSLLSERIKTTKKTEIYQTFEPTDKPIGVLIRSALKNDYPVKPQTLAILFAADRYEHLYGNDGILERTSRGELVISDRYAMSSLVYQGIDCGDELPVLLNSEYPIPEITFFLDIDPETALSRMKDRSTLEIFEYREFQEKVREKYKSLIKIYQEKGAKIEVIDASKSAQEINDKVWSIVSQMPIFNV